MYDADLIREVTDPRTGIMISEKHASFMPNAGELRIYCEALATRKAHSKRLGDLPKPDFSRARLEPPERRPGDLAQMFVPNTHSRYRKLVDWSATANPRFWRFGKSSDDRLGIWVTWEVWAHGSASEPRGQTFPEPTTLALSDIARKVMRDIDAERNGTLPIDQDCDHAPA